MPLTVVESRLRQLARERISKGSLPCALPSRVWGGKAYDQRCSLCDQDIESNDIEYEVAVDSQVLHLHILCHGAWQLECARALELKRLTSR